MSYYTQVLRQRVRLALTTMLERAHWAIELAAVLREIAAGDLHLPVELRPDSANEGVELLRRQVRQALTSVLAVERTHWARELAMILRELADELDPRERP